MNVLYALKHRYARGLATTSDITPNEVAAFLQALTCFDETDSLVGCVRQENPEWLESAEIMAILRGLDDCTKLIFRISAMDPHVENQLRLTIPVLGAQLLQDPDLPFSDDPHVLGIQDALNHGMMGWSTSLGSGGAKLQKKLEETVAAMRQLDCDFPGLALDVETFIEKESARISKLEQRLAASETGLLRTQRSKILTANMINHWCDGKVLSETLLEFLRGSWYNAMQYLVISEGVESESWQRAEKLTETLVWAYQPIKSGDEQAKQRLYRIAEELPTEVRSLLESLTPNDSTGEAAIAGIESDLGLLAAGEQPKYVVFDPIPSDEPEKAHSSVSSLVLRKVKQLEAGQWFTYTGVEPHIHIKLVLKLDDVHQLLFTNRNGMKVMQKSFDDFAYDLTSHVVRPLNSEAVFSSTLKNYYTGLIEEYEKHQLLLAHRRAEVDRLDQDRRADQRRETAAAEERRTSDEDTRKERLATQRAALLEAAGVEADKPENAERVRDLTSQVQSLNTGAFLKLPVEDGEFEEIKLGVKISAADKYIFVDRVGVRVVEFTCRELVQLLVAGKAEISDRGVQFEDTLAQVVTKLRKDRNKSYDDLTGA